MLSKGALASLLLLMAAAACSSGVTRNSNLELRQPQFSNAEQKAGKISVSITPEVEQRLAGTARFDQQKFLSALRKALENKGVLGGDNDPTLPAVEINVTDIRVRSTANAVLFGIMAGDDHINGDVIVRSPEQKEMQNFRVSTSYGLGGFGGGPLDTRMTWLYDAFAKRVAEELTGVPDRTTKPQAQK